MITLRLFQADKPFQQIDARHLRDGDMIIGRDPSADWVIDDAHGDVSRKHCILRKEGARILLVDTSSNGVRVGVDKICAPKGRDHELHAGQSLHIGAYTILLDGEPASDPGLDHSGPAKAPSGDGVAALTDAALLEQFCIGAGLEPSSLAGEDPGDVMLRLGAVYRQVVDDLCDLMRDRAMMKNQLQVDRTTISARDNNPLKWAPPHTIAIELLRDGDTGFLKGSEAFSASFADLRRHGAGLVEASRTAIDFVLAELDPDKLEDGGKSRPLDFISRHEAAWKRYRLAHAALVQDTRGQGDRIGAAARAGYQAYLDSPSETETVS